VAATELDRFAARYSFPLDAFQAEACRHVEEGHGVLVAAPTGAGKTVVGEFAVHLALALGQKCFYTTPIKALSNQKFADLVATHGPDRVGLLTGDNAVNGDAPVVVMTTEVLRNMLYAGSPALRGLGFVVMDEVHYLSDRYRGAVWEEVIIHLPESVRVVSLSATVSNAEEFGDWLVTVRGETRVVVSETRPVPLYQHMLAGSRLYDLFADTGSGRPEVNPALVRLARDERRFVDWGDRRPDRGGRRPRSPNRAPMRPDVIDKLDREGLLPAITFIFSRAGCDAAVQQCVRSGLRLNTADERASVRALVEQRCADLAEDDLRVLGYWEWLEGLERGIAAHHAGMIPTFKETVEELFVRGLVKAVFATETLALGINMPARSVVLEKLVKWNGDAHVAITPGEYTQLTGRAGRRGIDVEGHAVVLWQDGVEPHAVAGLASTRTYPLRSSFRPSYNMAVNLVATVGRERARKLLELSFAQFQADRGVVGLARQVKRNEEALAGYEEAMVCHLGNFGEYAGLRRAIRDREATLARSGAQQRRAAASDSLEKLRPGDVIRVPSGRYAGLAVVLDPGLAGGGAPAPQVLTADRQVRRLTLELFNGPVEPVGRVRMPRTFNARSVQARRDLAASLRNLGLDGGAGPRRRSRSAAADDATLARLRSQMRAHPCHGCAEREEHARWAERHDRLARDTEAMRARMTGRTGTVARTFDQVCRVLESLEYLDADAVTPTGERLRRVYNEADLLVVECLRRGLWEGLSPADLAACVSLLVYETRGPGEQEVRMPPGRVREVAAEMVRTWAELKDVEAAYGVDFLSQPDPGFAWAAHRWAGGARLEAVLTEADLPAGDFVRWTKMLLDLLGQVVDAADPATSVGETARSAMSALRRGVVATTGSV
jgi:ATP-dependent RNA helicase HelY